MGLVEIHEKVAPRCSEHFFDNSKARFTANSKLAFQAQTLNLRPFRFAKNIYRKNLNSRSELHFKNLRNFLFHQRRFPFCENRSILFGHPGFCFDQPLVHL